MKLEALCLKKWLTITEFVDTINKSRPKWFSILHFLFMLFDSWICSYGTECTCAVKAATSSTSVRQNKISTWPTFYEWEAFFNFRFDYLSDTCLIWDCYIVNALDREVLLTPGISMELLSSLTSFVVCQGFPFTLQVTQILVMIDLFHISRTIPSTWLACMPY